MHHLCPSPCQCTTALPPHQYAFCHPTHLTIDLSAYLIAKQTSTVHLFILVPKLTLALATYPPTDNLYTASPLKKITKPKLPQKHDKTLAHLKQTPSNFLGKKIETPQNKKKNTTKKRKKHIPSFKGNQQ